MLAASLVDSALTVGISMSGAAWNSITAGQSITCDDGHVIATALEPVLLGQEAGWEDKMSWAIPVPGERSDAQCPVCGALWFLTHTVDTATPPLQRRSSFIHVDHGWRGPCPLPDGARAYLDGHRGSIVVAS